MIFYSTLSGNLFKTSLPGGPLENIKIDLINYVPSAPSSTQYITQGGSFLKRISIPGYTPVWRAIPYSKFKFKTPVIFTTSDSAVATISNEGIINKVSSGTVTINASNGEGQGAGYILDTNIGDVGFVDYFVGFVPGYLSYEYTEALNALIRAANAANPNLTGPALINEFTTYGNSISGTYVRNLSCWAAPLDLTGVSVYNTRGGKDRNVTAITRRHVVNATHYSLEIGDRVLFLTKANQRVERTIIGRIAARFLSNGFFSDLTIYSLNEDLPETIKHYKVWNNTERIQKISKGSNGIMTQPEAPAGYEFYSGNFDKMLVVENNKDVVLWRGAFPDEQKFTKVISGGDSGSPTFFVLSSEPFLWGTLTQAQIATQIFDKNINASISALDVEAGINTGYTLEIYSLSAFPTP